jgi:hypothetical protein
MSSGRRLGMWGAAQIEGMKDTRIPGDNLCTAVLKWMFRRISKHQHIEKNENTHDSA